MELYKGLFFASVQNIVLKVQSGLPCVSSLNRFGTFDHWEPFQAQRLRFLVYGFRYYSTILNRAYLSIYS